MPSYTIPEVTGLPPRQNGRKDRKRVVVVSIPQVMPLEIIGPVDAFDEANFMLEHSGRPDLGYDIEVVGLHQGTIFEKHGFKLVVDKAYHDVRDPMDTLMFQAVDENERCLKDTRFIAWIRRNAPKVRRVASICAGTFILAEAGLLDGRRATTHWAACEDFRRRYPLVDLDPNPIYVKDGNLYSSAGVTSGIDLTLAMIEEDYGPELALRVAQGLILYLKRPGNQAQFSVHLQARFPEETRIREIQGYVQNHLEDDLRVEKLAARAGMSPRNFARVFAQEVGMPPGKFVEQARLEVARQLLERESTAISQVAQRCGYQTPDGMRLAFERSLGISPREYRQRFSSSRSRENDRPRRARPRQSP